MKPILLLLLLSASLHVHSQIRPFDNSKSISPWVYNPAAELSHDFQAYLGYDGRGSGNFMPQSIVAGIRMPMQGAKRFRRHGPSSMMGVQLLNTAQDLVKSSTVQANFSHEIPLTRQVKVALGIGAGVFSMRYNYDELIYLDAQDPLLNNGGNVFNMHLNAGLSVVVEDKFFAQVASPYLIKDDRVNWNEVMVRIGYHIPLNADLVLITAGSLDTYNRNLIYGMDVRAEWRKMVSFLAGADRYKFHGGVLLDIKPFALGYTYGMNYQNTFDHIPAHQISVFGRISPVR